MEHNEILGLDQALKFINTTLVHRIGRISLYDILEIHKRVLGHVDPIEAGQLRTTQVLYSITIVFSICGFYSLQLCDTC